MTQQQTDAEEIKRLRDENARLREALQTIVDCDDMAAELYTSDTMRADNHADRARAALREAVRQ